MDATEKLPASDSPAPHIMSRSADVLTGVSCGLYLAAWLHQALGLTASSITRLALQFVVLISITLACVLVRWSRGLTRLPGIEGTSDDGHRPLYVLGMIQLGLMLLTAVPALVTGPANGIIGLLGSEPVIDRVASQWLIAVIAMAAGWGLPLTLTFTLLLARSDSGQSGGLSPTRLIAVSFGIAFAVFVPGLIGGTTLMGLCGAITGCAAIGVALRVGPDKTGSAAVEPVTFSIEWLSLIAVAACGVLFASMSRLIGQLFLGTAWLSSIEWASVLAGAAAGYWVASRRPSIAERLLLAVAGWSLLMLAAFPIWISLTLDLKSTVSIALLSMALKALIAGCVTAPLGCCVGAAAVRSASDRWTWLFPVLFTIGVVLADWLAIPEVGVATAVAIAAGLLVATRFAEVLMQCREEPELLNSMRRHGLSSAAVCLVLGVGAFAAQQVYSPELSAKLLFDARVFTASQSSLRSELLPHLNEERCLHFVETPQRTLTFWRLRGSQIQLRESGVPVGVIGCDPSVGPQLSAESLQAILPLAIHERPSRILLTGLGSGAVLQTSMHFPLTSIDCIEPDHSLADAVSTEVLSRIAPSPLDDDRVRIRCCDPVLAMQFLETDYDVILCRPSQPVLSRAAAEMTADYLESVSTRLAQDGVCAQPLDIVDLGPDAVHSFVQTWRSVFANVAAIEIAPGRLLLMGTKSDRAFLKRDGFIDRLQKPHVRFALSQIGWDWSTPLQLATWTPEAFEQLYAEQSARVSRVSNMTLTCWLPWEVTRWGNKYQQVTEQLAKQSMSLEHRLVMPRDVSQAADIQDRLTELREQRDLIRHETDEYWAYRKVTKRMLTKSPRSELIQVKGEEPVQKRHPEDTNRLNYFRALGKAAKDTTTENLLAVAEYAQPHDPLITFFLHQEIAELARRDRGNFADIELQHRLYRAYYSTQNDRSVRNVVAAIELLSRSGAEQYDPVWRGDHLDALMQILHERWANRGDIKPDSSRVMLVDIEKSIAAVDQACDVMPELCAARGLSDADWTSRKDVLEKLLVRPLRSYRTLLLPHHERSKRRENQD